MPLGKVMRLAVSLTIKSAEVPIVVGVFRTRLDVPSCRVSRLSLGYSFLASILVPEIPAADDGKYLPNLWAYCEPMKKKYYETQMTENPSTHRPHMDFEQVAKDWNNTGLVVIPTFLDRSEIAELRRICDHVLQQALAEASDRANASNI